MNYSSQFSRINVRKFTIAYQGLACEDIRFSSLFAAGVVSRGGTSTTQRQKFHTDDVKSVRIRSEALIGRRSSYIVSAIVYEWQTKIKRPQRSNAKSSQCLLNIVFSRRSIWVSLELVGWWTQHFTRRHVTLDKIILGTPLLPDLLCKHESWVWNFCRWVADVPPRETSPAGKSEEKRMFSQANQGPKFGILFLLNSKMNLQKVS